MTDVMLGLGILSVVMSSVFMLNVVAPLSLHLFNKNKTFSIYSSVTCNIKLLTVVIFTLV